MATKTLLLVLSHAFQLPGTEITWDELLVQQRLFSFSYETTCDENEPLFLFLVGHECSEGQ